jgi:hypothetical protein
LDFITENTLHAETTAASMYRMREHISHAAATGTLIPTTAKLNLYTSATLIMVVATFSPCTSAAITAASRTRRHLHRVRP